MVSIYNRVSPVSLPLENFMFVILSEVLLCKTKSKDLTYSIAI